MAKRVRGAGRPGHRTTIRRPSAAPPARPSSSLTTDEEIRAAELEEQIVAEEKAAEMAARRTRERAQQAATAAGVAPVRARESLPLSVRAADEYAYVRRDIFRIARIGLLLLGIVAILYVLINVMGVISL
jgi:hypothetical protein